MSEFVDGLETVMLLGAARAGCAGDPRRLARLRSLEEPLRAAVGGGQWAEARRLVRSVMPADWEPGPEWAVRP